MRVHVYVCLCVNVCGDVTSRKRWDYFVHIVFTVGDLLKALKGIMRPCFILVVLKYAIQGDFVMSLLFLFVGGVKRHSGLRISWLRFECFLFNIEGVDFMFDKSITNTNRVFPHKVV